VSRPVHPVPRFIVWTTWLLTLVGLGLSIYLTIAHYTSSTILACSDKGLVNCALVTTSAQSYFLHVPVAVWGLLNFSLLAVISAPWVWDRAAYVVHLVRFVVVMGSMAMVLWLVYAELIIINHICLYCTAVHIVTFFLFVLGAVYGPRQLGWSSSPEDTGAASA
jgi:uncharacterized membrane protein